MGVHKNLFGQSSRAGSSGARRAADTQRIEDKYQALVDNLPLGIYRNTPGPKGRFLEANSAIVAMFGAKTKAEFLRHNVSDFYVDARKRKAFVAKIMRNGFVKNEQLELVTLTGRKFIASVTATMTKNPDGTCYFDGIIEDKTEQIKAQEVLKNKEIQTRLEQTFDNMIEGCQIISFDFRYLYTNDAAAKQAHATTENLLGRTMEAVYPGIEKTIMFRHLKRCMKSRKPYSMENEFTYPDGAKCWFELKMEPVPEGVVIFSEDVTKRRQDREALRRRNRELEALTKTQEKTKKALLEAVEDLKRTEDRANVEKIKDLAILENIGEGLITIDSNEKITMLNKAAEALLGQKGKQVVGKHISRLTVLNAGGQIIPHEERPICQVLKSGETVGPSFAEYYFMRGEKPFPIDLTVTPLRLHGKIIGAIEIFRDVAKEEEIDKAKTEFVSVASHQLRTPLGVAKWYLEAIRTDPFYGEAPGGVKDYIDQLYESNERVLGVVRDLLSVSRIDQGNAKVNPKQTDVVQAVKDVVHETSMLASKKNISLGHSVRRTTTPKAYVDPLRLHEVLQNLITNALEYTPSGGTVEVIIFEKPDKLSVSVRDTGIGISEDEQKKLFAKFYRSEKAISSNTSGSGLGLYIAKSYTNQWGGELRVKSAAGKGSTFTITLPFRKEGGNEKNSNH